MKLNPPLTVLALRFPRGLEIETCVAFLRAIAASPGRTLVSLEVIATRGRIQHFVVVSPDHASAVQRHLLDAVPGLRLEAAQLPAVPSGVHEVVRVRQRGADHQFDITQVVAASRQFLSASVGLRGQEQTWLRVRLSPAGRARPGPTPPTRAQANKSKPFSRDPLPRTKAREAKRSDFGLWAEAQLQVVAADRHRARSLAHVLTQHLRLLSSSLAALQITRTGWLGRRAFGERGLKRWTALMLNVQEAPGVLGWPLESEVAAGLVLGQARVLPRPTGLKGAGVSLGLDSSGRDIRLRTADRLRHLHIPAPSGMGKSTLLARLVLQDAAAGRGLVVIDPKADLVRDLLARLPEERLDDVIVVDPTRSPVVGINVLEGAGSPELRAEHVLHVFRSLFADSWGPRTDQILRAGLLTLTMAPGRRSLAELPLLLTNPAHRRRLTAGLDDPFGVGGFWRYYEALSADNQLQHIGPVLNKLSAALARPSLRAVLGQPEGLDIDRILVDKHILLVPLSAGTLGAPAARLLGSLLLTRLWAAIQARARLSRRPAMFVYLDEFQDLLHLPVPLDELLVQARGLGVGLTLAHQHLSQLTPAVRAAVLSSVRNRVVFQTGRADAKTLAAELGPLVTPDDLVGLPAFEAYAQLVQRHEQLPPLTLRSQPLDASLRDPRDLAARSAQRWGRSKSEVEQDLRAFLELPDDQSPVGRRRLS